MQQGWVTAILALGVAGALGASPVAAQQKNVAEEILEILRANRQIDEQQYRDLLSKARAEEEARQATLQATLETARQALETRQEDSGSFRLYWKEGVRFDSSDGDFKFKLGGRIQNDWALFDEDEDVEDALGQLGSGTEFRRARFYLEGEMYENMKFKAEYDFAGGAAEFKDVYIELKKLPFLGNFRIGHFKEPFSLEQLTSSRFITFMERSLIDVFVPERNTGMMVHSHALQERLTWAVGAFRETDDFGDGFGEDSQYNVTTRLTGLPWYMNRGRQLLHLGFSYGHKFRNNDPLRYRQRPEAHLSPVRFVDTGSFASDGIDLINPEVALVYGPFSLQGEYMRAFAQASEVKDPDFDGFYVYGSYFLTGENRVYKTSDGAFDRVSPRQNFDGNGGLGAWEVGLRYSQLDFDQADFSGGELGDLTVGLNWYLNPNVRFMWNYVLADLDDIGDTNIFQTRFQVDF